MNFSERTGWVDPNFASAAKTDPFPTGRPRIEEDWPEGVRSWCLKAPLGRYGTGQEVAQAIEFLLSATWRTEAILDYDGGMSAVSPWYCQPRISTCQGCF